MDFSQALLELKQGKLVSRSGWNGKNMVIFLVDGSTFQVNRPPLLGIFSEGTTIQYYPHIDMRTADDKIVPWLASQTDVLALDWDVVTAESQQVFRFVKTLPTITDIAQKTIFDNQVNYIKQSFSTGSYSTQSSPLQLINLELVHRLCMEDISETFIGVQPMSGPVGLIHTLQIVPAPGDDPTSHDRKLQIQVVANAVEARTRKLRSSWSIEVMQDASTNNSDCEKDVKDAIFGEIKKELSSEMINNLLSIAKQTNEIEESLQSSLVKAAHDIALKTRRGCGNFVITTPDIFEKIKNEHPQNITVMGEKPSCSVFVYKGTLNNTIDIYSCEMPLCDNKILVGYKGKTATDAGLFSSPYIPLISTGVVMDPLTSQPLINYMTRGTYFVAQCDEIKTGGDYYRVITVTDTIVEDDVNNAVDNTVEVVEDASNNASDGITE